MMKSLRRYCCCVAVVLCFFRCACAQRPTWVTQLPPRTETYYYRVAYATAVREEAAKSKAFATAIYESAFALGIAVDVKNLMNIAEDSALTALSSYVVIPVNMACSYAEELVTQRGYRVYVLCQVAHNANVTPRYKTFNCRLSREEQ
jgi:hypothetical protein